MKSIAMTKAEAKDSELCYAGTPDSDEAPKYPYGTCLDLNDDTLKKLGITKMPAIGEEVAITAIAKVTRLSMEEEEQGGAEMYLSLQITQMEVNIPSQVLSAPDKLYKRNS